MRIDPAESRFHPRLDVNENFDSEEIEKCELILRRLRFLEHKTRQNGGLADTSGGAAFSVWEAKALEWVLKEIEYLPATNREGVRP